MSSQSMQFWPRIIHFKSCWSETEIIVTSTSTDEFCQIIKNFKYGGLRAPLDMIKQEMEKIIIEGNFTGKILRLDTEVDDNGGMFLMTPLQYDDSWMQANKIYPMSELGKTINIGERLNGQIYEEE